MILKLIFTDKNECLKQKVNTSELNTHVYAMVKVDKFI